jgi:hypothetical protein
MIRRLVRVSAAWLGVATIACGGSPIAPPPVDQSPAVQSITPNAGSTAGGTEVTIRGLRFGAGATVTLGGRLATDVNVQSSESLTARTPAGASAGAVDVVVSVGGRSGSLPGGFTYRTPPPNVAPTITSITALGNRLRQPANFAELNDSLVVTAAVIDPETAADQLEYQWGASLGTISGNGRTVTWQAPASAETTPVQVTITLRVVERYGEGGIFHQEASGTRTVRLHDSVREIGAMAQRFLTEFSKPQTNRDVNDIMRDFKAAACPVPSEVEAERDQVVQHYTNYFMQSYQIGTPSVQVNFGGTCYGPLPGDACIAVLVRWNSIYTPTNRPEPTSGIDHLTAAYASTDSRWWLCSSRYEQTGTAGHAFYSSK